jgi:hypothetical protein
LKKLNLAVVFVFLMGLITPPSINIQANTEGITDNVRRSNSILARENYPYVNILEQTNQGILIEFNPAMPEIIDTHGDGITCQEITIPGLENLILPGSPALPSLGVMMGIPPGSNISFQIVESETKIMEGKHNFCLSQAPEITIPYQGKYPGRNLPEIQAAGETSTKSSPLAPVEIIETGKLRELNFARIKFNPVDIDKTTGEIKFHNRIQVYIDFGTTVSFQSDQGAAATDLYFEDIFQALFINYGQARGWRQSIALEDDALNNREVAGDFYKILVEQDGIYEVSYDDLADLGVDAGVIDPTSFQLFFQSSQVAIGMEDGDDGSFDPGDKLVFYGEKADSIYTDTNVYWLSWGLDPGFRMGELDGEPTGAVDDNFLKAKHFEEDIIYLSDIPSGPDMDRWYWDEVFTTSGAAEVIIPFNLLHLSTDTATASLRGLFYGYAASPYHHTKIYINDILVDDHTFTSGSEYQFDIDFNQDILLEGENTLKIERPDEVSLAYDDVLINWFQVDYHASYRAETDRLFFQKDAGDWTFEIDGFTSGEIEVLDISDPVSPRVITNFQTDTTDIGTMVRFSQSVTDTGHFLAQAVEQRLQPVDIFLDASSDLKSSENGADYLIISHGDFISAVQPLADYRSTQDYRVQVVDVQDIYDEFNGGVFNPEAIKTFIDHAYHQWQGDPPSYLLLVGDGHYDFKDNYGWGEENYIPPYLADVDPWIGEVPTDNQFVTVSGDDILPDLFVGRFAAKTADQVQAFVQRITDYEQAPAAGDWYLNQVFVADDADSGGNYASELDDIIDLIPVPPNSIERIFYEVNYPEIEDVRSAFTAAVNSGSGMVQYAGHASTQQWASPYILRLGDLPNLTNGDKLPFIIALTCSEGYFIQPSPAGVNYSSMGESIIRMADNGAIASWSPTGYGLTGGHVIMSEDLTDNLFNHYMNQLGPLTTIAKYHLYQSTSIYNDLIDTYLLFGDPALRIKTSPAELETPTELVATESAFDQIDLTWTDNSETETAFLIERSSNGTDGWDQIGETAANLTVFSDTGLPPNTTYHYRVRAFRFGDLTYSQYSNVDDATTKNILATPTNLIAAAISISEIDLSWTDNADDETAYSIERSLDGSTGWTEIGLVGADITTFSDTGLNPGTTYYYQVRAYKVGDGQFSEYSNIASATTNPLFGIYLPIIVR